jgi:hypothetical protein
LSVFSSVFLPMNTPAPVFDRLISVSTKPGQVQCSLPHRERRGRLYVCAGDAQVVRDVVERDVEDRE